jgi:hypothetical protein
MSSAEIILHVDGHRFVASGADEPRILDLELAEWLEFARPRKVRELIGRHLRTGLLNDLEVCPIVGRPRSTVERSAEAGGRPPLEYWLTRAGAVKVAAKSDTPRAIAILSEVVRVWDAVMRQLDQAKSPPPTAAAMPLPDDVVGALASQPRGDLRDDPKRAVHVSRMIGAAAARQEVAWTAIHGEILRIYQVRSYRRLPAYLLPPVERRLLAYITGAERFGRSGAPASGNRRQTSFTGFDS